MRVLGYLFASLMLFWRLARFGDTSHIASSLERLYRYIIIIIYIYNILITDLYTYRLKNADDWEYAMYFQVFHAEMV